MGEHYSVRLDLKLSKSFNSVGVSVEFGRDAKPNEKREILVKDVDEFVKERVSELAEYADGLLFEKAKKEKKSW